MFTSDLGPSYQNVCSAQNNFRWQYDWESTELVIGLHNADVRTIKLKSVSIQVIVPQVAKTKTRGKVSKS